MDMLILAAIGGANKKSLVLLASASKRNFSSLPVFGSDVGIAHLRLENAGKVCECFNMGFSKP
jgi:hypothetical protein